MASHSISEIPIPSSLSPLQRLEYESFRSSLSSLERELISLSSGSSPEYLELLRVVDSVRALRLREADERLRLKLEVIDQHFRSECDRISLETDRSKDLLRDRLIRSYKVCYDSALSRLSSLLSPSEYSAYISSHGIAFPPIRDDTQMKTRVVQPDEHRVKLSPTDVERDVLRLQARAADT